MKRFFEVLILLIVFAGSVSAANIIMYSSAGPNNSVIMTRDTYNTNAIGVIRSGNSQGDQTLSPAAFTTSSSVTQQQIITTTQNSWQGNFSPTGAFASELGGRLYFWTDIQKTSTQLSITDLSFAIVSDDTSLNANLSYAAVSFNGTTRWGFSWGIDGIRATADDIMVTSGTGPVDEILTLVMVSYASDQVGYAAKVASIQSGTSYIKGTATLGGVDPVSTNLAVSVVPEPTTYALFVLGGIGCLMLFRRKTLSF